MRGTNTVRSVTGVRKRGHLRHVAAVAILSLLLTACGVDDEESPSEGTGAAAETPVEEAAAEPSDAEPAEDAQPGEEALAEAAVGSEEPTVESSAPEPGDDTTPGDEDGQPPVEEEDAAAQDEGSAADQPRGGGDASAGTVTVDDVEYGISETLLCDEPAEDIGDVMEREVDLFARGADGAGLIVYIETLSGYPVQSVSWQGPEGVFATAVSDFGAGWLTQSADSVDGPPVLVNDDTVRSAYPITLYEITTGGPEALEITFEVDMPDGTSACR